MKWKKKIKKLKIRMNAHNSLKKDTIPCRALTHPLALPAKDFIQNGYISARDEYMTNFNYDLNNSMQLAMGYGAD